MIRDLVMGATKATYLKAWEEKIEQIRQLNDKAYK